MIFLKGRLLGATLLLAGLPSGWSQSTAASPAQRYLDAGQTALAAGQYEEAEKAFEKLRDLEPQTAEVYGNLGLIYFQEGRFEKAVTALRQGLKLKPSLPRAETLLAMSLSEMGKYDEALSGLEKGFRKSADPAIRRMCGLQLERAYTGLRRDSNAVEIALQMNQLYPNDPEVLYHSGKIFGNFAFLSIERLAKVAPDSVWRHLAAAEAQESQGANDAAIAEYRTVLAMDPKRPGVHYRIGRTLLARFWQSHSQQDTADALTEFEQELQTDPSNANAAYELGEMRRKAGQFGPAAAYFEQALKYYPSFEEAHLGLASVLLKQQKAAEALPHVRAAIATNPESEVSWYRLSQVEAALGHTEERDKAVAEFRRLHQKTSQQPKASDVLSSREVTRQELDSTSEQ